MRVFSCTILLLVSLLLFSSRGLGFEATELKPCEHTLLQDCLGRFIKAFSDYDPSMNDIQIHCRADLLLAKCTAVWKCTGKAVAALSKAILSYLMFDAKLRVCPRATGIYRKLVAKASSEPGSGFLEILSIILAKTPRCAKRTDVQCLRKYVYLMQTKPNLCVNIPKKYQCLQDGAQSCHAGILNSLLGVFPREADKVLHVLCP